MRYSGEVDNAMRRRYLVLLAFLMFLYIGPVNLMPSYVPSAIVEGT